MASTTEDASGGAPAGAGGRSLRLLVVDDSVDDFDLLLRALSKGPFAVQARRVESQKGLLAALGESEWDAVVVDHVIPGFGGPQAVKLLRAEQPDLAIVIVSGKVDEEVIANDLRLGADDYVFKSGFSRLAPALEQALAAAESRRERRRAEEALRASEARYRYMVEAAGVGLLELESADLTAVREDAALLPDVPERVHGAALTDAEAADEDASPEALALVGRAMHSVRPIDCNSWALQMFEFADKQEFFRSYSGLFTPEAMRRLVGMVAVLRRGGTSGSVELPMRTRTGRPLVCLATISFPDPAGRGGRNIVAMSDITERWLAETRLRESERRYRLVAENGSDVVWVVDVETRRFRYVSPSVERLRGYTAEEVMQQGLADVMTPESLRRINEGLPERLKEFEAGVRRSYLDVVEQPCKGGGSVWTEVVTTYLVDEATGRREAHGVSRDITARKRAEEARDAHAERLRRTVEGAVLAMGSAVERRDPYTAGHERRVTLLAEEMGKLLGLDEGQREGLRLAGSVHDIGKIGVPAEILSKPGKLHEYEYSLVQHHPTVGAEILQTIEFEQPVAEIVLQHHERMDGSGYPRGLRGDQIHIEARILAVADVFEAMASHRPYRPALGVEAALSELRSGAGTRYDADVVAACEKVIAAGFTFENGG